MRYGTRLWSNAEKNAGLSLLGRIVACIALVAAAGACDTIPREALISYVSAFDESRKAGELLAHDFAAAKAESERRDAARQPASVVAAQPEIPLTYAPPADGADAPSAVEVRLLAWEVISNYNGALAALSAGESVDSVKAATGRAFTAATKIASAASVAVPGIGAIAAAAQEIAELLEKARLSGEFKKAIAAGVPAVSKMLAIMIADAPDHYRLRAALANEDLIDIDETDTVKRERIKNAMAAFRQSLDRFVLLARKCNESLVALQAGADKPPNFAAQANAILALAQTMKVHWAAYQNARIEGAK